MQLRQRTHVCPTAVVHRNERLKPHLTILAGPHHSRVDGGSRQSALAAVKGRIHDRFHHGDQPVEGRSEAHVFDVFLQVDEAVLEGEIRLDTGGVFIDFRGTQTRRRVDAAEGPRFGAAGQVEADVAGQCNRPQPGQVLGQIAETFAEEKPGRPRRKRISPDFDAARAADGDVQPQRRDELVRRVGVELEFGADHQVGQPGLIAAIPREKIRGVPGELGVEVRRDPFREIELDVELTRVLAGRPDGRKCRQRAFVGDERIIGGEGGREEAVSGEAVSARGGRSEARQERQKGGGKRGREWKSVLEMHGCDKGCGLSDVADGARLARR